MEVTQSAKLANVCYDIRGPVMQEAKRMEAEGTAFSSSTSVTRPRSASRRRRRSSRT
ncbi:hypothetical protein ACFQX7_37660 [Luedemannella flava]